MTTTKPNPHVKPIDLLDFKTLFKALIVLFILVSATIILTEVFKDIPAGALFVCISVVTAIIMFSFQIANSTTLLKERERNKSLVEQNAILSEKLNEIQEQNGTDVQALKYAAQKMETKKNEYRTKCHSLETKLTEQQEKYNELDFDYNKQLTEITNLKTKINGLETVLSNDKRFENDFYIYRDKVAVLEKEIASFKKVSEPFAILWAAVNENEQDFETKKLDLLTAKVEVASKVIKSANPAIGTLKKKLNLI